MAKKNWPENSKTPFPNISWFSAYLWKNTPASIKMKPSKRVDHDSLSSYDYYYYYYPIISINDKHTKVPARKWLSSKMVLVTTSLQPEQIHFKIWEDFKLI